MTSRHHITARLTAALTFGAAFATLVSAAPAHAGPAKQSLVVLERPQAAYAGADTAAQRLATVADHRPITGERTILPIIGEKTGADGHTWLHVMLPGRPSGLTGWISPSVFRYSSTRWRIAVSTGKRRVEVFDSGHLVRSFRAVVGKASTPTPRGRFFVEETLVLKHSAIGAPFALALSARSSVLQQFDGGPGQIALHGLDNVGGTPGKAQSHGCVRLADKNIRWLAERIGPGVPVTIAN
jgi:lipoprotein-anchoring transpeptidase ErfK/SrfK